VKIRNGFVSNSSSSSFLVVFPKKPKTVSDVKDQLFGNGYSNDEVYTFPFGEDCPFAGPPTVEKICEKILQDINDCELLPDEEILNLFEDNLADLLPEYVDVDWQSSRVHRRNYIRQDAKNYCFVDYSLASDLLDAYIENERSYMDLIELEKIIQRKYNAEEEREWKWEAFQKILAENKEYSLFEKDYKEKQKLYEEKLTLCAQKDLEFFKKDTEGCFIFTKEYSDHKELESTIEHGQIFRKLPHIEINHH
jgi:hypothetical protein